MLVAGMSCGMCTFAPGDEMLKWFTINGDPAVGIPMGDTGVIDALEPDVRGVRGTLEVMCTSARSFSTLVGFTLFAGIELEPSSLMHM